MRWVVLFLALCSAAHAQQVPERAKVYAPDLVAAQRAVWPEAPQPWYLAGLVEQETCITLRHSKCWNPTAQLKTSREQGVGLGQFTRAWTADGRLRFDTLTELSARHQSLHGWSWSNWQDPRYQLTAIVELNKGIYTRQRDAKTPLDRLSFTLSAYNGGEGGLLQDRRLCANTNGCNPNIWQGNVANTSLKSKVPHQGYGKSFFEINREYVHNILFVRRDKYKPFWQSE